MPGTPAWHPPPPSATKRSPSYKTIPDSSPPSFHPTFKQSYPSFSSPSPLQGNQPDKSQAKRGFAIAPYPYFSKLWFVDFDIALSPAYGEILRRVQNGEKMLHPGCGVGQDIRRVVYNGAPSENLCGLDPHRGLADLGYELFLDRDELRSAFSCRMGC